MDMVSLNDMVKVLGRKKLRKPDILGNNNKADTKHNKLYHMMLEDEFSDENEIAQYFSYKNKEDKSFLMFKNRFINKLSNHVFLLNSSTELKKTSREQLKAYYYVYLGKILELLSANHSANYFFKKALKYAEKYNLYELKIAILERFIMYSSVSGDYKTFAKYRAEFANTVKLIETQGLAMLLFEDLRLMGQTKKSFSSQDLRSYKRGLNQLNKLLTENKADFQTLWYKHAIALIYFNYIKNWDSLRKEMVEAEALLAKFPKFNTNAKKALLNAYKLELVKFSDNKKEAPVLIEKIQTIFPKGTTNWVSLQLQIILYFIFVKEFYKGYKVYKEVVSTATFKTMPSSNVEYYNTIGAYFYFYFKDNKLDENIEFNLFKYINDIQIYHIKDKTGMNATLMLIEILYYYTHNLLDKLNDKRDAIFIYKHRHLTDKHTERIKVVFDTLIHLIDSDFNDIKKSKIIKKAQERLAKKAFWGNYEEVEIVPFDAYLAYFL